MKKKIKHTQIVAVLLKQIVNSNRAVKILEFECRSVTIHCSLNAKGTIATKLQINTADKPSFTSNLFRFPFT